MTTRGSFALVTNDQAAARRIDSPRARPYHRRSMKAYFWFYGTSGDPGAVAA